MEHTVPTEQFGIHLMVDGYGASREKLSDATSLRRMLTDVTSDMGMHPIHEPIVVEVGPKNRKDPGGLSGFIMIAESHISFHTFPNRGFVTIDVYTCHNELDSEKLINLFKKAFELKEVESYLLKRGLNYPSSDIIP